MEKKQIKFQVIFSYCIPIEAETEEEAIRGAMEMWGEISPLPDEMNIDVEITD